MDKTQEISKKIEEVLKEYNVTLKVTHNIQIVPLAPLPEQPKKTNEETKDEGNTDK